MQFRVDLVAFFIINDFFLQNTDEFVVVGVVKCPVFNNICASVKANSIME